MTRKDFTTETALDQELEAFFDAGRAKDTAPSDQLVLNVLADAKRLQPHPLALPVRTAKPRAAWFDLANLFTGWRAGSALAGFLAIGVFLGYSAPAGLDTLTNALAASAGLKTNTAIEFSLDDLMAEG